MDPIGPRVLRLVHVPRVKAACTGDLMMEVTTMWEIANVSFYSKGLISKIKEKWAKSEIIKVI